MITIFNIIRRTIIAKLILVFLVIVLLPNMILAIIAISYTQTQIHSQIGSELILTVNDIAKEVDQRLYDCFLDMMKISKAALVKENGSNKSLELYLKSFNRVEYNYEGDKYNRYFSLALIDNKGSVLNKTREAGSGNVEGDWIKGVFQGKYYVSDFLSSPRFSNKPVMIFCAPVYSPDGRISKAVVGWLNMEYIRDLIETVSKVKRESKFGGLAYMRLFNTAGKIINAGHNETMDADLLKRVFKGEANYKISKIRGRGKTIISYATLLGLSKHLEKSWKIAIFQPVNDTSMPALVLIPKIKHTIIVTAVIVCLIAIIIAYFMGDNIARPIKNLAAASKKAMEGDLDVSVRLSHSRSDEIGLLVKFFNHMIVNMKFYMDKFKWLSITDALTGLYNKRFFEKTLDREIRRSERYERPMALVMVDIDKFKECNDSFGHLAGDNFLKQLADIFNETVRSTDYSCRYGGEEFALILPETKPEDAYLIAERIRRSVEKHVFQYKKKKIKHKMTISAGVASCVGGKTSADVIVEKADKALYNAKDAGRNLVVAIEDKGI